MCASAAVGKPRAYLDAQHGARRGCRADRDDHGRWTMRGRRSSRRGQSALLLGLLWDAVLGTVVGGREGAWREKDTEGEGVADGGDSTNLKDDT